MSFGLGPAIGAAWIALLAIAGGLGARVDGRFGAALGAYAFAIGVGLGAFASGLALLRARLRDEGPHDLLRLIGDRFGIIVVTHVWIVMGGMARTPQLYDEAWYQRGALPRTVQILATDVLGPVGVALLGFVAFLVYLLGSPSYWGGWHDQARRSLTSIYPRVRRSLAPGALGGAACLLLVVGLVACASIPRGAPERPNVLVIVASSLRADRVDARYAPHLAALATRGAHFDRAYATSGSTMPALVNLLTGRDPNRHGIHSSFARWEDRARDFDAVPARFAQRGYATTAIADATGDVLRRVDLGFARVLAPSSDARDVARRRALARQGAILPFLDSRLGRDLFPAMRGLDEAPDDELLTDDAIRALDREREKPFFLTVVYSTTQAPYAALSPWYARSTRAAYRGRFKYDAPIARGAEKADTEDVAQIHALYDGAVASVDASVGRLLAAVERRKLGDRTIVVLVADHGEGLHENGHGRGHGDHLFGDERSHVPFVIVNRGASPMTVPAIVRDVDLAPTLYALADVAPPADLDGRPLDAAIRGEPLPPRPAFAETAPWRGDVVGLPDALRLPTPPIDVASEPDDAHGGERVLRADAIDAIAIARHRMVKDEHWKLVYAPTRSGGKFLLFDTDIDKGETHDVAAAHPDETARLEAQLWKWMLADPTMTRQGDLLVPREHRSAR
jgi:arylsulfatase A-like enzyme